MHSAIFRAEINRSFSTTGAPKFGWSCQRICEDSYLRPGPIWLLIRQQHRAPIEPRRQTRDNGVCLHVPVRGEGSRRAAENITRRGFGEVPTAAEIDSSPVCPPVHISPLCLSVHRQRLAREFAVDVVHVTAPVILEPGGVEKDSRVRTKDP